MRGGYTKMSNLVSVMDYVRGKKIKRMKYTTKNGVLVELDDGSIVNFEANGDYCDKLWLEINIDTNSDWVE
jgi:hypothetical protein